MNKKGVIIGVVAIAIIAGVAASLSSTPTETVNLDMTRTHGTISTAMGSPILGDPSAPVTIVEFGDYQCHQCYNWFHNTKPAITRDYIDTGKANLVFVDMAFLGRDSGPAAQATYCAEDQGKYWEYHDMLYNAQEDKIDSGWANTERLKAFAFSMGLDMELFESCLDSGKYSKRVQYNTQQARDHGVRGTPGFFIVGPDGQQQIGGAQPFSVFKQVLDPMV
ncbi:putative disulfide bond formation protein D [Marine Group I thaumarchaeote SCGC AAA799-E16]|uniref:Na antiporter NhaA 2 protein n=5 Tax=Marine Group I TaxID=905826 RepID=A0A087RYJ6_9ARCH|nr:putative disulfide bond formation protein D [Marine Group I thaumarchaeote SCGC AAA799-E16]KFM16521.1 putative disulfide bond formation protein D [Marine Group I thaumarchaeote SCGC AAA799-D11]KFM18550.1 Na antiporter NhaA 2 protein [Marine Group I thaumarchaeote SCGC RSA3]KFM22340.1 putative disulfide bond formation protein D [Marine Group I thaumarchaeote SCGC AAA799-B03]